MNRIFFYGADKVADIKNKKIVKQLIVHLFKKENTGLERLNYIFCSDEYLLKINKQYLNHDTLTDIITFPLSEKRSPVYGEVYLSVERIKENAKTFNTEYQNEILRVIIHGALHLCGYQDKTKQEKMQMREKENHYLNEHKSFT